MRTTSASWIFIGSVALALALVGCSADSTDVDPGPGDGPAADEPAPKAPATTAPTPAQATTPAAPSSPAATAPASADATTILARGEFVKKGYSGSGTALFVAGEDNAPFLRLENIAVSTGPALHVLLTKEASPSSKADVDKGSLDLGVLRATKGNLTYTIPAGTDVKAYAGVIVYCVDYSMVFTAAPMTGT